jgi:hypothetical protein
MVFSVIIMGVGRAPDNRNIFKVLSPLVNREA